MYTAAIYVYNVMMVKFPARVEKLQGNLIILRNEK